MRRACVRSRAGFVDHERPRIATPALGVVATLLFFVAVPVEATPTPVFPVSFAVTEVDGGPVVDRAWLEARVAQANHIFGPHGIAFETSAVRSLAASHARLETRDDRHALGAEVLPDVVNVFVVASLRDVDDPAQLRRGVHWRPEGYPGRHLVIVTEYSGETVLAHELGHFFGNHQHSPTPGNIMSYDRGEVPPFFDAAQSAILQRHARRFIRSRELVPITTR